MFNIGFTEMLFIAILALVLLGPKQLPEVARTIGRFLNELRRSSDAIKEEFVKSSKEILDQAKVEDDEHKKLIHQDIPGVTHPKEDTKEASKDQDPYSGKKS